MTSFVIRHNWNVQLLFTWIMNNIRPGKRLNIPMTPFHYWLNIIVKMRLSCRLRGGKEESCWCRLVLSGGIITSIPRWFPIHHPSVETWMEGNKTPASWNRTTHPFHWICDVNYDLRLPGLLRGPAIPLSASYHLWRSFFLYPIRFLETLPCHRFSLPGNLAWSDN